MTTRKQYSKIKEKRIKESIEHTEKMDNQCSDLIKYSIENTKMYSIDFKCEKIVPEKETEIIVTNKDSVSALYYHYDKMAVLNFASYKKPGGGFINGSIAQEECLCYESFLYNVLREFPDFYEWNSFNTNKALYLNRALYSPYILFNHAGNLVRCDVITCAAPNLSAARKYYGVTDEENFKILYDRIRFMLDIAKENGVETLILGAYGCGVFGQDPRVVAKIFKELLTTTYQCFDKVIFAIPGGKNLEEFKKVFN